MSTQIDSETIHISPYSIVKSFIRILCGMVEYMERDEFVRRLVQLRMAKGVSARDMSLSLGQSESYINGIENGKGFPSMTVFFYICEYFGITPMEFFDTGAAYPGKIQELVEVARPLPAEQLDNLISLARAIQK